MTTPHTPMSFRIPHPARFAVLAILVALILTKIVWVQCCCRDIGSVTYFNDGGLRGKLLKTSETAGTTISRDGRRHYLL